MSTRNPYVGPNGEQDPEPSEPRPWTDDELAEAEHDVKELLALQVAHCERVARFGQHGLPASRTRSYYAAKAYLLQCLLYPPRIVMGLPDPGAEPISLDPHAIFTVPEPEGPDPRLRVHYRCPSCSCGVPASHVPDSEDCRESAQLRLDSIRADG